MGRFTLLAALFAGLVCLIDLSPALAHPSAIKPPTDASQMPNIPSPGDFPRPPGMLHNRVSRQAPPEVPGQDQFPPPPPPPPQMPQMRSRRNARTSIEMTNILPALETISYISVARDKRAAKGTGGKLPSKAG
ncbi:arp2/3 complex-activating protein rickA-like [Anopheles arabiensis]|uniref:arp2/3 complex-activating protein rickA-like n=1 Tax=Anopheles arabiensis TaxID=7173 RepID=UPI001AACD9CB|nr:arp2/3 complex-activating protein rickA-like [Anopheles arabiensis]